MPAHQQSWSKTLEQWRNRLDVALTRTNDDDDTRAQHTQVANTTLRTKAHITLTRGGAAVAAGIIGCVLWAVKHPKIAGWSTAAAVVVAAAFTWGLSPERSRPPDFGEATATPPPIIITITPQTSASMPPTTETEPQPEQPAAPRARTPASTPATTTTPKPAAEQPSPDDVPKPRDGGHDVTERPTPDNDDDDDDGQLDDSDDDSDDDRRLRCLVIRLPERPAMHPRACLGEIREQVDKLTPSM